MNRRPDFAYAGPAFVLSLAALVAGIVAVVLGFYEAAAVSTVLAALGWLVLLDMTGVTR